MTAVMLGTQDLIMSLFITDDAVHCFDFGTEYINNLVLRFKQASQPAYGMRLGCSLLLGSYQFLLYGGLINIGFFVCVLPFLRVVLLQFTSVNFGPLRRACFALTSIVVVPASLLAAEACLNTSTFVVIWVDFDT